VASGELFCSETPLELIETKTLLILRSNFSKLLTNTLTYIFAWFNVRPSPGPIDD